MNPFKVLIIDDQLYVRRSLQELLSMLYPKATIFISENDGDSLQMVKDHQPHFISLDLTMPGLGGKRLCPKLMDLSPNSSIYIMSALNSNAVQNEMKELGAKGFLNKPVNLQDLKLIVDKIHEDLGIQV
ncbi:MAG: response regulator [Candidatus Cloacimonetes bacterium]|nr:response regulator [Candidatus Cloacimonadota bacterium]